MYSLKKQKGFTIVELLIVIVVIGILATLVIVTFTGIQQRGRNSQRQTDINATASQLAAFYADKGYYPTYTQMTDATWVSANLKGLDPAALVDPKGGTTGLANGASTATQYGYKNTLEDGTTACTGTGTTDNANCTKYVLEATLEGSTDKFTRKSN